MGQRLPEAHVLLSIALVIVAVVIDAAATVVVVVAVGVVHCMLFLNVCLTINWLARLWQHHPQITTTAAMGLCNREINM